MRFAFTEDQLALQQGLREFLVGRFPASSARHQFDEGIGIDRELWTGLAALGVTGLLLDETSGGMGFGLVEAVLLCSELGRAAVPGPVLETLAVVAPALRATPWADALADGSLVATANLDDEPFVAHAPVADLVLEANGVRLLAEAHVEPVESLDRGRRMGRVAGGSLIPVTFDVEAARARASLAVAAALIGASEAMMTRAADYARERQQFGKPIGSFQAVKHLLADALLQVEFAKAPAYRAAWSLQTGHEHASRDVSMARVLANEAAHATTRAALQVHGAIGYTWECDLQLWMKYVWALERAYGSTTWHRRRVTQSLLGGSDAIGL